MHFHWTLVFLLLLTATMEADANGPAERDVWFHGANGVTLAGTLTLPAHSPGLRVPGMVLVAGSGPTDRNGNQGAALHTDLLKQMADSLAQHGIASLRYDKRGIGLSQKQPTDAPGLAAFYAWENFVADTTDALCWLQAQPEIDPNRTGLLGHSEGGLLVLQAAVQWKGMPHPPRVLVLASTPGRPTDEGLHDQIARLLKLQQATPEQTRYFLDKNDAICAAIRKTGKVPDDVPPGLAVLYPAYLGKFLHSLLAVRPAELATKYRGPVLVLQGAKDVQVSPGKDAKALDAALRRRKPDTHALHIVPNASHNLKLVTSAEEEGFTGAVAPDALAALPSWLTAHLVSRK